MKVRTVLLCALAVLMLSACAPNGENEDVLQSEPPVSATPYTPTPTPEITPEPEPMDTEEGTTFTFMVEGVENTVAARRHTSTLGYSMVYDPAMLTFDKVEDIDTYTVPEVTNLPTVQIMISKSDMSFDQVVAAWKKTGAEDAGYMRLDGCETKVLHYAEGNSYDAKMITCYVVQVGEEVFVIENHYFMEAAEGSGSRMAQMVDTITFADVPDAKELKMMFRDKEIADFTSVIGDVTTLRVGTDAGAACRDVTWTSSDEKVCTVVGYDGICDVEIKGEGVATITATCGDLSASTVVRGKRTW